MITNRGKIVHGSYECKVYDYAKHFRDEKKSLEVMPFLRF